MMRYLERFKLENRTAAVTGGARGIGAACVEALIEAGAEVHVLDILKAPDRAAAASLDRHAVYHRINLRDPDAVEALAAGLASPAASYVTGAVLLVDGGYTCW